MKHCTYCPVCGYLNPTGERTQCGYCHSKMIELTIDFGFFIDMYHIDTSSHVPPEILKEPIEKATEYVLENFGKDHPLYNPQKRQDRLDTIAAAERGETIPTCPNCGSHQIQAVCDSFPFGTIWRVCLACGHKFR